jgi:hypothetical protein
MAMYRAMMEKKDKKEKAIKNAEAARALSIKNQHKHQNAWGDRSISEINNSMERMKGSVASIKMIFSAEEKNKSMIVERN